mgnify:CR=1 FL=1
MSEGEYYNIEKILDRKNLDGKVLYKIKWEGYPMSESTWEPMKNLESAKEIVEEYNRTHPMNSPKKSKPQTKKRGSSLISKKRNGDKEDLSPHYSQNDKEPKEEIEINCEKINKDNNDDLNKNKYIIDDSLKGVVTVKQQNQGLVAIVEKLNDQGVIEKITIPTENLRISNPWILLNFYESKIKFT